MNIDDSAWIDIPNGRFYFEEKFMDESTLTVEGIDNSLSKQCIFTGNIPGEDFLFSSRAFSPYIISSSSKICF